jgi:hypothetical protein
MGGRVSVNCIAPAHSLIHTLTSEFALQTLEAASVWLLPI